MYNNSNKCIEPINPDCQRTFLFQSESTAQSSKCDFKEYSESVPNYILLNHNIKKQKYKRHKKQVQRYENMKVKQRGMRFVQPGCRYVSDTDMMNYQAAVPLNLT